MGRKWEGVEKEWGRSGSEEEVRREREWESSWEDMGKKWEGSGEGEGGLGKTWGRTGEWGGRGGTGEDVGKDWGLGKECGVRKINAPAFPSDLSRSKLFKTKRTNFIQFNHWQIHAYPQLLHSKVFMAT